MLCQQLQRIMVKWLLHRKCIEKFTSPITLKHWLQLKSFFFHHLRYLTASRWYKKTFSRIFILEVIKEKWTAQWMWTNYSSIRNQQNLYYYWQDKCLYNYTCFTQTWGKHLAQMLEALPQALGKGLKHKHKCFNKINASSTN